MKIKDRPEFKNKPPAFVLFADDLVSTAIAQMAQRNIGSVVVVDHDNKVRGILTERDLLRRLLARGLDPGETRISQIMTTSVRTASPEDHVIDWLRQMSNERFRHLPVLDNDGRLLNILSQGDFVSYTWPELWHLLKEKTSETFRGPTAPAPILMGGLMLYSLLMVGVMKYS